MLHVTSVCPSAGKGKGVCLLLRHVRRSPSLSLSCLFVCPGKTEEVFTEEKNSEKKKEEEAWSVFPPQIKVAV